MRVHALPRLFLATALVVAPVACASGPQRAGVTEPGRQPSREEVMNRDRALVAGLATSIALGLVGLGSLLANANFVPRDDGGPHEMPTAIAVTGGIMSLGFIAAVPLGVAVERHRNRYPYFFNKNLRAPRTTASLRPGPLVPGPSVPAPVLR